MCYFNTEVRLTVIFQNTSLLALWLQRSATAHTSRATIKLPLFATISGSSAELRTTDRGGGTIITAWREGEMLKLVRQTLDETICGCLRGSPPLSIACKTTTHLGRATDKVTVNSMQHLFWSYVELGKIIRYIVNLLMSCKETLWSDSSNLESKEKGTHSGEKQSKTNDFFISPFCLFCNLAFSETMVSISL